MTGARLLLVGLRGSSWAVGASVCAHGAALAVGLRFAALGVAARPAEHEQLIDVDVVSAALAASPPPEPPPDKAEPREPQSAPVAPATTKLRVGRPAPGIASGRHDAQPAAASVPMEASPAVTTEEPLLSFDLGTGQGAGQAHGAVATAGARGAASSDGPLSEQVVSTPARLTRGGVPPYPAAARADGIEGDVVLELIVSTSGAVESVRVAKGIGHGLDEAALAAVRAYRFSAAIKDGHPVRVRMRWPVQFRLD